MERRNREKGREEERERRRKVGINDNVALHKYSDLRSGFVQNTVFPNY